MEIWKPVPSQPHLEASDLGRIRLAVDRPNTRWKKGKSCYPKGWIFTPSVKQGYEIIRLTFNKKRKQYFVHRLICEAFHGLPPTALHKVAHDDGNQKNNKPDNVLWKTQKQNIDDRERHGNTMRGEKHYGALIDNKKARLIRILAEEGFTTKEINKKLKVSIHIINDIRSGRSWKHA